ncbi:RND transporter [Gemmatimonadetes bacterium T265]|nr:RND transporter [Gemmatimonadetes bacterium T265]
MRPSSSFRRLALGLAGVLFAACKREPPPRPKSAVPVTVATATTGTVPLTFVTNGTVEPTQTVAIQPQAQGAITEVRFNEGDEVRAGQVLFVIDPRPYQAALAQAQATLARDQATAVASRADAARYGSLVSQGYVTQSQAQTIQAQANAIGATIAADQAQVDAARVNLSYTAIRAPISGRTGNLNVRLGNQVRAPNPVPLVTINAIAPVLVRFPVPDGVLPQVRQARQAGHPLDVTITGPLVNGAVEHGSVDFIDNAIDTVTGTLNLKARFANTDRRLWPGSFLPLTLTLGETRNAVLVPSTAVQEGPQGEYVFMPGPGGKARQVAVTVDRAAGPVTIITKGLSVGDTVVADGQSRLTPGADMKVARTVAVQVPGAAQPGAAANAERGPNGPTAPGRGGTASGTAPERVAASGAAGRNN